MTGIKATGPRGGTYVTSLAARLPDVSPDHLSKPLACIFFPIPLRFEDSYFQHMMRKRREEEKKLAEKIYNIVNLVLGLLYSLTIVWVVVHLYYYKMKTVRSIQEDGSFCPLKKGNNPKKTT